MVIDIQQEINSVRKNDHQNMLNHLSAQQAYFILLTEF